MRYIISILLTFFIFSCKQDSKIEKNSEGFHWVEPKKWQSMGPICFNLQAFPIRSLCWFFLNGSPLTDSIP